MSLVLAIEPDRRQAAQLTVIVKRQVGAELVLADTTEHALKSIGNRVPDLVLVPALLSPRDDAALATALRVIAAAAHVQMLTIPVLAAQHARPARRGMFASLLGKTAPEEPVVEGCAPSVFAEQIASYLARAAEERQALQQGQALASREAERAATAAVEEPLADRDADVRQFEEPSASTWEPEPVSLIAEQDPPAFEPVMSETPAVRTLDWTPAEPATMTVEPVASTDLEPVWLDAEKAVADGEPEPTAVHVEAAMSPVVTVSIEEPITAPVESLPTVEAIALDVEPAVVDEEPAWREQPAVASLEPERVGQEPISQQPEPWKLEAGTWNFEVVDPDAREPIALQQEEDEEDIELMPVLEQAFADVRPTPGVEAVAVQPAPTPVAAAHADKTDDFDVREWLVPDEPVVPFEPVALGAWRVWPAIETEGTIRDAAPIAEAAAMATAAELQAQLASEEREEELVSAAIITPQPRIALAPPRYDQTWADLIESLRSDLDRMKIDGAQPAAAQSAPAVPDPPPAITSPKRTAAASRPAAKAEPISLASKSRRRQNAKSPAAEIQDEWGLFDPEKCGFGALPKKLDEITDAADESSRRSA